MFQFLTSPQIHTVSPSVFFFFRPEDDGSFRRRENRRDHDDDFHASRGDADNNWRRGGGGGGGPADSGSFRGSGGGSTGSSFRDDRRGGGGFDRGGQGGGGFDENRGSSFDRRGGGYDNNIRSGGGGFDRNSRSGGFDNSDRGGYDRGSRAGGSGGFDDNRRGGDSFDRRGGGVYNDRSPPQASSAGSRPRLQLKARTAPLPQEKVEENVITTSEKVEESDTPTPSQETQEPVAVVSDDENKVPVDEPSESDNRDLKEADTETLKDDKVPSEGEERKVVKKREPEVVNSRAAALEAAPTVKSGVRNNSRSLQCELPRHDHACSFLRVSGLLISVSRAIFLLLPHFCEQPGNIRRDANDRTDQRRAPPPVVNKRFEQLAEEERGKQREREAQRGPPPVANSRFAAAAEADRSSNRRGDDYDRNDRGPPPVANSRFAAAAEADRSSNSRDNYDRNDRGPPPIANSRFAAAAEADRSHKNRDRDDYGRNDRGPPPIANSRFAAAAEADRSSRQDYGRDDRGPPPVANSRFASAAAMAEEEDGYRQDRDDFRYGGRNDGPRGPPMPQNSRFAAAAASDPDYVGRSDRERQNNDRGADERFGGRDEYGRRDGRDGYGRRGGGGGRGDWYDDDGRGGYGGDRYDEEPPKQQESKSSVADLLKPKARPLEENILKVPTKEQADNMLKAPHADNSLKPPSNVTSKEARETKAPVVTPKPAPVAVVADDSEVLAEFVSGKILGEELKTWLKGQQVVPSVERLVFHLLTETEKLNPDVECPWAELDKYGAVLTSLVEEDLLKQMEVLFAVQKYCEKLGMPKLDDEYVIQSMFRAMYKYDLASDEAFAMWKEDESTEHEDGKLKAVVQTVDWFNWLEQDDDDEEDDDGAEEEE